LLILDLTALELRYPRGVTDLPVVREVRVRWYAMRLNNEDPSIQASAAHALSRMGPNAKSAVAALVAALDSSRSEVRDAAARALGNIGPDAEAAVESLTRLQGQERDSRVQKGDGVKLRYELTALKALGQRRNPRPKTPSVGGSWAAGHLT
jgi:HEAT repeat protein